MADAERRQAAEAFWTERESIVEQAEVMALIARKLNFRFKSVQAMSTERKVKHLMALGNVSDGVAGRLLVAYHLAHQRPMMAAFLDALGIPHDNGLIAQDETPQARRREAEGRRRDASRRVSRGRRRSLLRDAGAAGSRDVGWCEGPVASA